MNVGDNIKNLRVSFGMTQKELSERIDVSAVTVRNWETGAKTPYMEALISLAEVFHISIDKLVGLNTQWDAESERIASVFRRLDRHGRSVIAVLADAELERVKLETRKHELGRIIPLFTSPAAAGYAAPIDESECQTISVGDDAPAEADYCVVIHGNSMLPHIHDEQIVFVKQTDELSVGDIGIFSVDGCMYCKQMFVDEGRLILVSSNPEYESANVVVEPDSSTTVKVCGKVLIGYRPKLPDYITQLR